MRGRLHFSKPAPYGISAGNAKPRPCVSQRPAVPKTSIPIENLGAPVVRSPEFNTLDCRYPHADEPDIRRITRRPLHPVHARAKAEVERGSGVPGRPTTIRFGMRPTIDIINCRISR